MEKLPDSIVQLDMVRLNRDRKKFCSCAKATYEVDEVNRVVTCRQCGAWVEPFAALADIAHRHEEREREQQRLLDQRREILNYKPHLLVMRELERGYRGKTMLPACPHCHRGLYFEELNHWVNRKIEDTRRGLEKETE